MVNKKLFKSVGFKTHSKAGVVFLFLLLMSFFAEAQTKSISGKVIDQESKLPILGVSIIEIGTNNGATTDFDGKFSMKISKSGASLQFIYMGYATQTIKIGSNSIINVELVSSASELDEIIVIGYGTVRKKDLTGSVGVVGEKDFNRGVVSSPDQLIQGRVAGVQLINNSGQPGGANTIRIRGNTSFRSGNDPLYVVDGVQITNNSGKPGGSNEGISNSPGSNPLSYLNPDDVESVQILKDASATAIYGSRGSNGVIIITTKKGRSGKPTIELNSSFGFSVLTRDPDNLSASEYRTALNDYGITVGDEGASVNAFDEITRDVAITNSQSISIGSATEKGSYRFSLGYFNQEGIIKKSELERVNANIRASFNFLENDKLKLDLSLAVAQTDEITPPIGTSSGATGSLISSALAWNPTQSLYNPDGTIFQFGATEINSPIALLEGFTDESTRVNIIGRISPSYQITENLLYKIDFGFTKIDGKRSGYAQRWVQAGDVANRGFAFINTQKEDYTVLTHTLNYTKDFNDDLSLNLLAGYEWQRTNSESTRMSGQDFQIDILDYRGFISSVPRDSREIAAGYSPITELQSYFGRANINIKDKYLLTATFRADGSNKFGENNKYGYFPSAAFAWNINNEEFLEDGPFSNLKLRLSWGQTGNQSFPANASLDRFAYDLDGSRRINAANPNLKWETTSSTNIGVDFGILGGKLRGSIDYFSRTTEDLLFSSLVKQPGPEDTRVWSNLTDSQVTNKGMEFDLSADIIAKKNFNWNLGVNATFIKNNLENFVGAVDYGELYGKGLSGVLSQRLEAGQPLNSFYLPVYLGTDADGVDQFKTDADGVEVKEFVGDSNPDVVLGISTNFTVGKWTAGFNFNGVFGQQLLYNTGMSIGNISNLGSLNIASTQNGFDIANGPKASSKYIFNGDYLRLSNATISYDIGDYKSIKNIQVFFSGNNLFTITNYPGIDPEVNTVNSENGINSSGIEYEAYPTVTTFMIGTKFSL